MTEIWETLCEFGSWPDVQAIGVAVIVLIVGALVLGDRDPNCRGSSGHIVPKASTNRRISQQNAQPPISHREGLKRKRLR